ncbi:uncharacterized [Tachysurus ichikawai]
MVSHSRAKRGDGDKPHFAEQHCERDVQSREHTLVCLRWSRRAVGPSLLLQASLKRPALGFPPPSTPIPCPLHDLGSAGPIFMAR